jgi:RNA polymerase sigma-70 factor, ECF subfamily
MSSAALTRPRRPCLASVGRLAARDETLVQQTLAGDLSAFETLVERHRGVVHRVAARIVGPTEADDVTQDTFLRAFHRLGQFRGESPFLPWLLRVANSVALNTLARQRRPDAAVSPEEEADGVRDSNPTPVEALEERERRERLTTKLQQIQPTHRTVLVLRDLEGLSYEEIAVATGSPLGSVKGRLFRARRELIEILRHNTYDWGLPDEPAAA